MTKKMRKTERKKKKEADKLMKTAHRRSEFFVSFKQKGSKGPRAPKSPYELQLDAEIEAYVHIHNLNRVDQ